MVLLIDPVLGLGAAAVVAAVVVARPSQPLIPSSPPEALLLNALVMEVVVALLSSSCLPLPLLPRRPRLHAVAQQQPYGLATWFNKAYMRLLPGKTLHDPFPEVVQGSLIILGRCHIS